MPTPGENVIRCATPGDLPYVTHLQKIHSNAVGFLPTKALEWYIDAGHLRVITENDDPAGYIVARPKFRWNNAMAPLTQTAIDFSAQRRHLGLALVLQHARIARERGQVAVQAMCRADLDANLFWSAAGFVEIGRYQPDNKRNQPIICWRKQLSARTPAWFNMMPPLAGWKARALANNPAHH